MTADKPINAVVKNLIYLSYDYGYYLAFACVLFGIKLWTISTYGNATPFWDQWDAEAVHLYLPFLEGTLALGDLISPHNEHRIFTTRITALLLLEINGIWNPLLQMVTNSIAHIIAIVLLVYFSAKIIGKSVTPILLLFSAVVYGFPYAWENTLCGFQSPFYYVFLFSIAGLWFTVTSDCFSIYWWLGLTFQVLAYLSLASGVCAVAASGAVVIMIYILGIRRSIRQLLGILFILFLLIVEYFFTPQLPGSESLRAQTPAMFWTIAIDELSWPSKGKLFSVVLLQFPSLTFVYNLLKTRPSYLDNRWFFMAILAWSLGQTLVLTYTRGVFGLSSRYLDLLAVSVLTNFILLIYMISISPSIFKNFLFIMLGVWLFTVLPSLVENQKKRTMREIGAKHATSLIQEENTRNYIISHDRSYIFGKVDQEIPYPNADHLANILNVRAIKSILPQNVREPLGPISVEVTPLDSFIIDGLDPKVPRMPGFNLGSYSMKSNNQKGKATVIFDTRHVQNLVINIPVSGKVRKNGMGLKFMGDSEEFKPSFSPGTSPAWQIGRHKIAGSSVKIELTDENENSWIAIGAPWISGRLDFFVENLLTKAISFLASGVCLAITVSAVRIKQCHTYNG